MSVTTFEGVVEKGQIRLPVEVCLPEKAKVYVVIPNTGVPSQAQFRSPRLAHAENAKDFAKEVIQEGSDASV